MTRGRGGGVTCERLMQMLQQAINAKGQSTVERETGLSSSMISRYKRGIGEPSTATLEKLAGYFGVTVGYLRGMESLDFTTTVSEFERVVLELQSKRVNPAMDEKVVSESRNELIEIIFKCLSEVILSKSREESSSNIVVAVLYDLRMVTEKLNYILLQEDNS